MAGHKFTCPIFGAETNSAACGKLMNMKWMGKQIDVRKGCQACMDSSKCPIVAFVKINEVRYKSGTVLTLEKGLPREVLERIRPIVVQDQHLNRRGVSSAERAAIAGANDRIDAMIGRAPKGEEPVRKRAAPSSPPKRQAPTATKPKIDQAAATGDMSAAISRAAA